MAGRTLFGSVAVVLAILSLAGCGWHLRGEIPGSTADKTLFISGIGPRQPFYGDFTQALTYSGGFLAKTPKQASAVVHIVRAIHERRPITLSKQGRANTFDLTFRVLYDIRTPKGEVLVPQQELEIRRDYFNDQSSPLGQGEEEAQMRMEMQKEAAQALLRQVVYTLGRKTADKT
jgi:LPS-assembly lipoprotein